LNLGSSGVCSRSGVLPSPFAGEESCVMLGDKDCGHAELAVSQQLAAPTE